MALDDYTRRERRKYLGSSDAAAVCGLDPYRTAGDVWAEKTGRLPAVREERSPAIEVGEVVEPAVLAWAERKLGAVILGGLFFTAGARCANLDGLIAEPTAIVEAKAMGIVGRPPYLDDFGDAGTDMVPEHVRLQVHHQFAVMAEQTEQPALASVRLAYVPALLGLRGLVLFAIERDDALVAALVEREEQWWRDYVVADRLPPDDPPSLDTLYAMVRNPALPAVPVPALTMQTWLDARQVRLDAEKNEARAQQALLLELGDAMVGDAGALGQVKVVRYTRRAYSVAASEVTQVRPIQPKEEAGKR